MRRAIGLCLVGAGIFLHSAIALAQERIEPALESQPVPEQGEQEATQDGQTKARQEEEEAERLVPSLKAIESAIRDLIAEEDAIERNRQEQREIADLQAQKDMASWAKLMFFATAFTVGLTFAGLILILRTLVHTRRTADAAIATADATNASNTLHRETFILQNRAWLVLDQIDSIAGLYWENGAARLTFRLSFVNVGPTPATDFHVGAKFILDPHEALKLYESGTLMPRPTKHRRLIPIVKDRPHTFTYSKTITADQIRKQLEVDRTITGSDKWNMITPVLFCWASYDFAFGDDQLRRAFLITKTVNGAEQPIGPSYGDIETEHIRLVPFPPENIAIIG